MSTEITRLDRDIDLLKKDKRIVSIKRKGTQIEVITTNLTVTHPIYGSAELGKMLFVVDFSKPYGISKIRNLTFGARGREVRWVTPFIGKDLKIWCPAGYGPTVLMYRRNKMLLEYVTLFLEILQNGKQTIASHGERYWFPRIKNWEQS